MHTSNTEPGILHTNSWTNVNFLFLFVPLRNNKRKTEMPTKKPAVAASQKAFAFCDKCDMLLYDEIVYPPPSALSVIPASASAGAAEAASSSSDKAKTRPRLVHHCRACGFTREIRDANQHCI